MAEGRVFIIGIDGGSWDVMLPLVESGHMPRFRDLISASSWGTLLSTIPYITCPAWNCLVSGKNPGWIGAFGFLNLEPSSYSLSFYDYRADPEVPEIWDILGERGITSGVVNLPVARNPRPVRGYMIPGFLADDRNYRTYPESVRLLLEGACGGYEIEPRGFSIMEPEKTVRECIRIMEKRFKAIKTLIDERPTDLFFGVFHLVDRVCHNVINRTGLPLDDQDRLGAAAVSFFEKLDVYIGTLVEDCVKAKDMLVIASDHGFAPSNDGFLLNSWLIKEGYLDVNPLRGLSRLGINQRRIAGVLDRISLLKPAIRLTPRFLRKIVPEGSGSGAHVSVVDLIQSGKVDWASTLAVALPNHGIYLNTSDRPQGAVGVGSERDSLIEEMRKKLLDWEDPETGQKPVAKVSRREELYSGPRVEKAPDLVVETMKGWETHAMLSRSGELSLPVSRADHRREGIFLLRGPGIRERGGGEACIEDITPTVLDFMGINPTSAMDGKSLL